ncbi:MAG TPA: hypothetical protein VHR38_15140, partial [Solirubrobacterales bacterium]|nr:hypothetical protein [Solirubrobacterales bacterium]
ELDADGGDRGGTLGGPPLRWAGGSHPRQGLSGVAIPFETSYRSFWTGLGIVGGYLAAVLGLSFYIRGWIGPKLWRQLHRWTLVVFVLGVIHTIGAGTDAGTLWLTAILVATATPIALLTALRWLSTSEPGQGRRRRIPLPSEQF